MQCEATYIMYYTVYNDVKRGRLRVVIYKTQLILELELNFHDSGIYY